MADLAERPVAAPVAPPADDEATAFLAAAGFAGWRRAPLAGDASGRRYERLTGGDGATAILMDASREPATLGPFQRVAEHLRRLGLAAPRVLAADEGQGLLLVEDLGPRHAAAWLAGHPEDASVVYATAVDALVHLQAAPPPPGLPALTPTRAAGMIAPLFEHYAPRTDPRTAAALVGALADALAAHAPDATVLALRDFHAENLVWRPERDGTDRLGLLDFQDAVLAPPEYDLASLLRDARRDVEADLRAAMLRRFANRTGRAEARAAAAAAVLGLARNLRILGVFVRLARERGKPGYLGFLPRVWAHVEGDLAHPALAPLAPRVRAAVPPPAGAGGRA